MSTAGEARAKILAAQQNARTASGEKRMRQLDRPETTVYQLAIGSFDDGFGAGYAAGYQAALDAWQDTLENQLKAQRSGIMATWP